METTGPAFAVLVDKHHNGDDGDQGEEGADSETHCLGMYLEEVKARRGRGDRLFGRHVRAAVDVLGWAEFVQCFLAGFDLAVAPPIFLALKSRAYGRNIKCVSVWWEFGLTVREVGKVEGD